MEPEEIAKWMLSQIETDGVLHQDHAASEIEQRFGAEFAPANDRGNLSIRPDVLKAFRTISEHVIWERGERLWRKRESFDEKGRLQV